VPRRPRRVSAGSSGRRGRAAKSARGLLCVVGALPCVAHPVVCRAPRAPLCPAALYYYHFPAITGVAIDPFALIKAIEEVGVPTFRGMKFTEYK
jgi:hypothetical protein